MTAASNSVEEAVRAHLQAGTSEAEAALRRRRLLRNVLMGGSPLLLSIVFGRFSQASGITWMAILGLGTLVLASFAYRYRRLRPGLREVVPEAEVENVARKSTRCPGCGTLVLPDDAGECIACGRLVKPLEAVLTVAAFLALVIGSILWGIYR
jgi:hypothetical protein